MSKLVVKRRSEFANRARKIGLYLNDEKIAVIENGESKEFDLQPGSYSLKAKIDWCGSQVREFEISENEDKNIELTGFTKNKWMLPILIVIQLFLLVLSFYFDINHFLMMGFSLGLIVYLFYPITFGRNHYLRLVQR